MNQNISNQPEPQQQGQWVFVPGQVGTVAQPSSSGLRIAAGVVALVGLVLAIPAFINEMFFVYGTPMSSAMAWINFLLLVSIGGILVTGIRILAKHRTTTAGTPRALQIFSVLGSISYAILGTGMFYGPVAIAVGIITTLAAIVLCQLDLGRKR